MVLQGWVVEGVWVLAGIVAGLALVGCQASQDRTPLELPGLAVAEEGDRWIYLVETERSVSGRSATTYQTVLREALGYDPERLALRVRVAREQENAKIERTRGYGQTWFRITGDGLFVLGEHHLHLGSRAEAWHVGRRRHGELTFNLAGEYFGKTVIDLPAGRVSAHHVQHLGMAEETSVVVSGKEAELVHGMMQSTFYFDDQWTLLKRETLVAERVVVEQEEALLQEVETSVLHPIHDLSRLEE